MADHNFDLVILGSGSGGYAAALRGAQLGMSVALIERGFVIGALNRVDRLGRSGGEQGVRGRHCA